MSDVSLAQAMVATAANAVTIAATDLGNAVKLDYSEASIVLLEDVPGWEGEDEKFGVLEEVSSSTFLFQGDPFDTAAEIFGGYVGEVFRRHHGGEWVWPGPDSLPALRVNGNTIHFVDKVYKRLKELDKGQMKGEHNIWHFYQVMAELLGS